MLESFSLALSFSLIGTCPRERIYVSARDPIGIVFFLLVRFFFRCCHCSVVALAAAVSYLLLLSLFSNIDAIVSCAVNSSKYVI